VLVCGLATLDVVQTVDHVPASDEKLVADALLVAAGGPAANAAVTCALLGGGVRLVTRIGGGAAGAMVAADLAAHSVDVVDLAAPGDRPPVSTVLVTRGTGERAVVSVNATGLAPLSGADAAALLPPGVWDGVGVLLVDGHHLDLAMVCAAGARARGVPVVLDGGSWKPGLEGLLRLVDVAVLSADFEVPGSVPAGAGQVAAVGLGAGQVAPGELGAGQVAAGEVAAGELGAVRALGPYVVAQSHGADPIVVLGDGGLLAVPVPAVAVVDTLGAGDVLHGALVAWLARRGSEAEAGSTEAAEGTTGAAVVAGVMGAAAGAAAAASAGVRAADVVEGLAWAAEVASASCASAGARGWADDVVQLGRWNSDLVQRGRDGDGGGDRAR
jgi:sugar/nucleoside kinase (ribokinase family)